MTITTSQTEQTGLASVRKVYTKPRMEQVRLALEEAVLGTGCKTSSSSGPSEPCQSGLNFCLIEGS